MLAQDQLDISGSGTDYFRDRYIDLLKKTLTAFIYDESAWTIARRHPVEKFFLFLVPRLKRFLKINPAPFNPKHREEGVDWPLFAFTMVGLRRLDNIENCIKEILRSNISGDFVEAGSWRGGSTIFMRALLSIYDVKDRTVWVADSFEGMPVPKSATDGADLSGYDFLRVPLEKVKANFAKFGLLDEQVKFLKGWFCDTLPNAPIGPIALLRLDGDLYSSTMDTLNALYNKVTLGGFIIVDDYNTWESCKRAVTDFLASRHVTPEIIKIDDSAVFWKKQAN